MTSCRVVLADDQPMYLEALGCAITATPELELIGTANNGRDALALVEALRPEVAVLDVHMPLHDGAAVTTWLRKRDVPTRVLFLSDCTEGSTIYDALAAGGAGYLCKRETACTIVAGILRAAAGERFVGPALASPLLDELCRRREREGCALTERERAVLDLAAGGLTVASMGQRLCLSPGTVKVHLATLYAKLGAHDRRGAVVAAFRQGLLQ
jgi:two-component system nitrate/nitrite response regulator NarL